MKYLLGIDQGTTQTTVVVVNELGEMVEKSSAQLPARFPQAGWVEQDPFDILRTVKEACAPLLDKYDIDAVGFDNQGETFVVWDKYTGEPVTPAIVWQDTRGESVCKALTPRVDLNGLRQKTGLLIDSYFSAPKLKWVFETHPEIREQAHAGKLKFGTTETWVIWSLTGGKHHVTDPSTASRTLLFDMNCFEWDEELLALFDVPRGMLPEVKPSAGLIGEVDFGNGKPLPLHALLVDQQAALFGQACFNPGEMKCSFGTGSFLLMNIGDKPRLSDHGLLTTVGWNFDGHTAYAFDGGIFVTGSAVQWLRDNLKVISDSASSSAAANRSTDSSVVMIPALQGLAAPHWRTDVRGAMFGLNRSTTSDDIVRAEEEVTATYAGLRAATEHSDYQIASHAEQKYICVGGIRSTGISASLGIAEYVADLLKEAGVALKHKPEFKTIKMPNIGEAFTRPYQSAERIEKNSEYGKIVCHCERVSLGELNDATWATIPVTTLDGLRRRTRAMQGRCQGFNCHASLHVMLRERSDRHLHRTQVQVRISNGTNKTLRSQRALPHTAPASLRGSDMKVVDVLIVGAGPAGLAAALELKRLGIKDILVAERESEAGGIPRMCGHVGFGITDLHRVMTGPNYARNYREMAEQASIPIHTNTTITGWDNAASQSRAAVDGGLRYLEFTSPQGLGTIAAKCVLLATGVRERPRAARLVPGHRPQGIFTTGSLQRFVYEHHLPVGKRAVIIGAERVSLSVVMTLRHAGVKVLNMITELPQHQLYLPIFLLAKILYADILTRAPILTNTRISNIFGHQGVEGIEVTKIESGKTQTIECDTVVFSGDWIPENELARRGEVETSKPWLGPQVDSFFRTSQLGVFAAGNLLRGVETADWAALEGRSTARSIARYLENASWSSNRLEIQPELPLAWICPNVLSPDARVDRFRFRSNEFGQNVNLQLMQSERVLYQKRWSRLVANTSLNLDGVWVEKVDFDGAPVKLVIQ